MTLLQKPLGAGVGNPGPGRAERSCVVLQRKRGFALPIQRWFRDELRDPFRETVLEKDSLTNEYLDRETVQRVFDEHRSDRAEHGHHLWSLLMFEHWLRYVSKRIEVSI